MLCLCIDWTWVLDNQQIYRQNSPGLLSLQPPNRRAIRQRRNNYRAEHAFRYRIYHILYNEIANRIVLFSFHGTELSNE